MSQRDGIQIQVRLRRLSFRVLFALIMAVILTGGVVKCGSSPHPREVKNLRRLINSAELFDSYHWYSPSNIFVLRGLGGSAWAYSLNVETGVRSDFKWLIPYISEKDLITISGWAISWPLRRLSVLAHTANFQGIRISSFDLDKQLEEHTDVQEAYRGYAYLPWRDSWLSIFGTNQAKSLGFYTAQKGLVEVKPSPVRPGTIFQGPNKMIFVLHRHNDILSGPLDLDALRIEDAVTLDKHLLVSLSWSSMLLDLSLSPDGKWFLIQRMIQTPDAVVGTIYDVRLLAINLETSSTIEIMKIDPPFNTKHTARWLPDGKSVSLVVDGELRVWTLFD